MTTTAVRPAVYLGVDPGASGGLAAVGSDGTAVTEALARTDRQIWDWFGRWQGPRTVRVAAAIEKVQGYIGGMETGGRMKKGPGPRGASMFKFGRGVGFLHGCLVAAGIPYEEIIPRTWQKALGVPPRRETETRTQWKNRLRQHAERLFPGARVTLAVADALLIAEYCRRQHEGTLR